MTGEFNPSRLTLLRERAGMTKEALATACDVSRRAVTDWEAGRVATPPLNALAKVFSVGPTFFSKDDITDLEQKDVSFRALSTLGARKAKQVISAARLCLELSEWLDCHFHTPSVDLPTIEELLWPVKLQDYSPRYLALTLRNVWALGDRPITNMLRLVEERGVRVFGIPGQQREVDAFSFWHAGRPYIFLCTDRSAERMRFDLAHELGHLILHRGISTARERSYESEANEFAASFLMPPDGVLAQVSTATGQLRLPDVMTLKRSWKVSAVAMVRRLYDLGAILEWHYRHWMVDLSARGYRRGEPDGSHPEQSRLIGGILQECRRERMGLLQIAAQAGLPVSAVEDAFQGLTVLPIDGGAEVRHASDARRAFYVV